MPRLILCLSLRERILKRQCMCCCPTCSATGRVGAMAQSTALATALSIEFQKSPRWHCCLQRPEMDPVLQMPRQTLCLSLRERTSRRRCLCCYPTCSATGRAWHLWKTAVMVQSTVPVLYDQVILCSKNPTALSQICPLCKFYLQFNDVDGLKWSSCSGGGTIRASRKKCM